MKKNEKWITAAVLVVNLGVGWLLVRSADYSALLESKAAVPDGVALGPGPTVETTPLDRPALLD